MKLETVVTAELKRIARGKRLGELLHLVAQLDVRNFEGLGGNEVFDAGGGVREALIHLGEQALAQGKPDHQTEGDEGREQHEAIPDGEAEADGAADGHFRAPAWNSRCRGRCG